MPRRMLVLGLAALPTMACGCTAETICGAVATQARPRKTRHASALHVLFASCVRALP